MNTKIQEILIRRKSKANIHYQSASIEVCPANMIAALIGNFGSLGYVLSEDLYNAIVNQSTKEVMEFYSTVFPILKKQVGCDYSHYKPMYPNFPEQVANASDTELFINAILHYFGDVIGERIIPEYDKKVKFPFCEETDVRFLGLATQEDISAVFSEIFESKSSPSIQDKEDIKTFFEVMYSIAMSPDFTNKERMAFTLGYILNQDSIIFDNWSRRNVKTATDILRIAIAYSNGDESLTKPSKFSNFPRSIRKKFLSILNEMNQSNVQEDMKRFLGMWIRFGEKLHPSEYTKQYPKIATSFDILRNGKLENTNSKIEKHLQDCNWTKLVEVLKTRPGDFARRLNAIITKTDNAEIILDAFESIADKISTPVLWQLYGYYNHRDNMCSFNNRIFLPKTARAIVTDNNLAPIDPKVRFNIVNIIAESILLQYEKRPKLGKVWIDPICKNLLIPSGNRSVSTALRQVARGSRFELAENKNTLRLFVYWKDLDKKFIPYDRVDLDLSAIMFDKDWKFLSQCSWTQLRNGNGKNAVMVHSGDITSAPNGASEFLDINLDKLDKNVAYIACNVYCYTGQKMTDLNIGYMGWMEREFPGSGEIFEPKSVINRCDLTANATSTAPLVLDVQNREIIWCDLPLIIDGWGASTENTLSKSIATATLISRMSETKQSLYDVFFINVFCRGIQTFNKDEADFVINEDGDLSPYDLNAICSDWL